DDRDPARRGVGTHGGVDPLRQEHEPGTRRGALVAHAVHNPLAGVLHLVTEGWRAGRTRRQRASRGERRERSPLSATRSLCPPPSPHSTPLPVGSRHIWCSPVRGKTRRLRLGYASTSVFSRAPSRASQTLIRGASLVHSASREGTPCVPR